jgi:hypothetical protein
MKNPCLFLFLLCFYLLQSSLCGFSLLSAQNWQLGVITGAPDVRTQKFIDTLWGFEGGLSLGYLPQKSRFGFRIDAIYAYYQRTFVRPSSTSLHFDPRLQQSFLVYPEYTLYSFPVYVAYSFLKPNSKFSLVFTLGGGIGLGHNPARSYVKKFNSDWLYSSALRLGYNASPRYKPAIEICHKWVSEAFIPWNPLLENTHYFGLRLVTNFTLGKIK